MFIHLDFETDTPIYEQLKNEIIIGIAKGEIRTGERLPSVRKMAKDIGINMHTVNKAYQQLRQEGFLLIHRQRGVVVHPDGPSKSDDAYKMKIKERLTPMIAESLCRQLKQEEFEQIIKSIYKELHGGAKDE